MDDVDIKRLRELVAQINATITDANAALATTPDAHAQEILADVLADLRLAWATLESQVPEIE